MAVKQSFITCSIADIAIAVSSYRFFSLPANDSFYPFLNKRKAEVRFFIKEGPPPLTERSEVVFSSADTWSVSKNNGTFIIETTSAWALCKADFSEASIYFKDDPDTSSLLSYPLDELLMRNILVQRGGLMMHACGLSRRHKALLFIGPSGSGKSTSARLWIKQPGVRVLNDDRIIIRKSENSFYTYATPWHGDVDVVNPEKALLESIFFIKHSRHNYLKKLTILEAASRLLTFSFFPIWDAQAVNCTLEFCRKLALRLPAYEYGFRPDQSAVDFLLERL